MHVRYSNRYSSSCVKYLRKVNLILQATYTELTTLGRDIPVSNGRYELDAQKYQCSGEDCHNYEVGLVEVELQDKYTPQRYK